MICGNCNNTVPEGYAFCPFCGQKVEAPAPVEIPVMPRSAMPGEEEYAGRYATGDMPEPEIRFSSNLRKKEKAPVEEAAPVAPAAPAVVEEIAPVEPVVEAPVEEPVAEAPAEAPVEQKTCACGAPLREGAKFCNHCGAPVQQEPAAVAEEPVPVVAPVIQEPAFVPPVVEEEPAPVFVPPVVAEEPAPVFVPPVVEEEPAPVFVPPVVEEAPAPVQPEGLTCACGAPLREGAKFCNFCGRPVEAPAEPEPPAPAEDLCPACGAKLSPGAKFCNVCGQRLAAQEPQSPVQQPVPPVQQPVPPVQQPAPVKKCPLCGTVVPADAPSCTGCGVAFRVQNQAVQAPAQPTAAPTAPKRRAPKTAKKSKTPLIVGIIALIAIVGVVVAGFLLGWFGSAKPLTAIYDAVEKTVYSGGFNAEFEVSVPDVGEFTGKADCILDIEEKELTLLAELEMDGETMKLAVLDGKAAVEIPGQGAISVDISGMQDMVFEAMGESMSFDEALETIVEVALEASGMEETIDGDKALECMKDTVNTASWMKKNAGYSTKNEGLVKLHVLEPKLGELAIAAVEAFEPAFEDADMVEEGLESLKEGKSELNDMADIEVAFGIQGGKLVKLTGQLTADGRTLELDVSFKNIGSAKVDTDAIEELLEGATPMGGLPGIFG